MIEWEVSEYIYKKKNADWYIALSIITVSASAASFLLGNTLFAILIIIGIATLMMYSARKPNAIHIELNKHGVLIDDLIHPYNTLDSFWVEEYDKEPKIIIQSKKILMPYIIIPIGPADPEEIREFLYEYMDEEEHMEPFTHKLMDYLGF